MAKEKDSSEIYKILLGLGLLVASYSLGWYRGKNNEQYI